MQRRQFIAASAVLAGSTGAAAAQNEDNARLGRTPHTRFAVNIEMWWNRREVPFVQRIIEAARLGFPAVEIWPYEGRDLDAIMEACQKHRVEIAQFTAWGFRPGLNDPKNHNRFVDKIEEACKVAHRLNCRLMTVVAGDDVRGMSQQQMHENVIAGLRRAAPIAEKHNVTMILEPMNIRVDHKGHCLYGSEPTVRIIKAVNSRFVKINWDLYHMQISEGDLCGHLRDGYDALGYVQIADHPGRNQPGTGEIYYPRVLKQLHDLGYRGYVGLELVPRGSEVEAARAVNRADQW
jgi:hydroxypyruvate isomerase